MSRRQVFSLKEEARQTSRRGRTHWTAESRLRKNPVAFTSSGVKDPFKDGELLENEDSAAESGTAEHKPPHSTLNVTPSASTSQSFASTTVQASCSQSTAITSSTLPQAPCEEDGQEVPPSSHESLDRERPSSAASSDEEVILFTGRNRGPDRPAPARLPASEIVQELERDVEMAIGCDTPLPEEDTPLPEEDTPLPEEDPSASTEEAGHDSDEVETEEAEDEGEDEGDEGDGINEGDAATDDFLANLLASGEQLTAETFTFRQLGASDDEICFSQSDAISGTFSYDSDIDFMPVGRVTRREKKRAGKLGRKGKKGLQQPKPHDLFTLYPDGMTMDQVVEELQGFLLSSEEQLSFPPLSKSFRKMLHEMAGKLHLKSKSIGKGDTRRPVLYRTKGTRMFDPGSFEAVTSRITRRFWGPRSKPGTGMKRGGRGGAAFTGYRDGEVVGSHLPELNSENRGRAMLEKMGWSTGMALGSDQNKGILQPVAHVMKRSKAGLGQG